MSSLSLTTSAVRLDSDFFIALAAPVPVCSPSQSSSLCPEPDLTSDDEDTILYEAPESPCSIDMDTGDTSDDEANDFAGHLFLPEGRRPKNIDSILFEPIYTPFGKWEWIQGRDIEDIDSMFLSEGASCSASINTARVSDRELRYVCKSWYKDKLCASMYVELTLYKTYLKSLQGLVVPNLINVFADAAAINMAFEPPHHSFWIEASPDMPMVLKNRCIQAFDALHYAGVVHKDVELRHMLIGGDGKVTLIDFEYSVSADKAKSSFANEVAMERRKVLFRLDYPGAREIEEKRRKGEIPSSPEIEKLCEAEWWESTSPSPRRFVMPGQSAEQVRHEIQNFLTLIDKWQGDEFPSAPNAPPVPSSAHLADIYCSEGPSSSSTASRIPPQPGHPTTSVGGANVSVTLEQEESKPLVARATSSPIRSSASGLSLRSSSEASSSSSLGKRKLDEVYDYPQNVNSLRGGDCVPLSYAEMLSAVASRYKRFKWPLPAPSVHFRDLRPDETGEQIQAMNITRCDALGLPHPVLLERNPMDPRWLRDDVQEYVTTCYNEDQEMFRKTNVNNKGKIKRMSRSLGYLKRTFAGIHRGEGPQPRPEKRKIDDDFGGRYEEDTELDRSDVREGPKILRLSEVDARREGAPSLGRTSKPRARHGILKAQKGAQSETLDAPDTPAKSNPDSASNSSERHQLVGDGRSRQLSVSSTVAGWVRGLYSIFV